MSEPLACLNGRLLPASQAKLDLHDAGFVMGATVTDLCRTVHHQLYKWQKHLERFQASCRLIQIELPVGKDELTRQAHELAVHNASFLSASEDLALVLLATPGPIGYYAGLVGGVGDATPTWGMHTFRLPFARYLPLFREGAQLAVATTRQVPAATVDPRIKQRSRLHWWIAGRELHAVYPGATAILLNDQGHLTETAAANLLIVRSGVVYSPPAEKILGGISLLTVEQLCHNLEVAFVRRPLQVDDAITADEIMLTSTGWCLCGVSRFNGLPVPWPGPLFQRLLAAWSQQIGLNIRQQVETSGQHHS